MNTPLQFKVQADRMHVDGTRGNPPVLRKRPERRAFKACHCCNLGKRQCENARPCGPCTSRGIECKEAEKDITCALCREKKLKCDKGRPCGRCSRLGFECQSWLSLTASQKNGVRRKTDETLEENVSEMMMDASDSLQMKSDDRPRLVPTVALLGGSFPQIQPSSSSVPSVRLFANTLAWSDGEGIIFGQVPSDVEEGGVPKEGTLLGGADVPEETQPWPKTLLLLFQAYRSSEQSHEHLLANATPKLRSTMLRICRASDVLLAHSSSPVSAEPQGWAKQRDLFRNSTRCGLQTQCFDSNFRGVLGVDVNQFWADLAGVPCNEYAHLFLAGFHRFPTSELRHTHKLFRDFKQLLVARMQARASGAKASASLTPTFMRVSRHWTRADREHGAGSHGVLVRVSGSSTVDPAEGCVYLHQTVVEVTEAEYEAARARDAAACEGDLIPVVGAKSAAVLLDPRLEQLESFANLNATAAGRAALDSFAARLEQDFVFLFHALADLKLSLPSPSPSSPSPSSSSPSSSSSSRADSQGLHSPTPPGTPQAARSTSSSPSAPA